MDKLPERKSHKTTPWRIGTIAVRLLGLIMIIAIIAILVISYRNNSALTTQLGKTKSATIKQPLDLTKKRNIKPVEIQTADALNHINQANLYTRISYFQLTTQQDPASAVTWLDLARQQVQLSKSTNASDALESIAVLKEKINQLPVPNLNNVQTQLDTLRKTIDELTIKKAQATAQTHHAPETSEKKSIFNTLSNWWQQFIDWAKSSISIQSLNQAEYQTMQNSLQNDQFNQVAMQLIDQATLAATYQDTRQFGYALGKLDLLIKFSVIDPKVQQPMRQQIETLQQQPVSIKPPCFRELFILLGQPMSTETNASISSEREVTKTPPSSKTEKNAHLIQEIST